MHNWWRYAVHSAIDKIIAQALFEWGYQSLRVAFDTDTHTVYTSTMPGGESIYTAIDIMASKESEAAFRRIIRDAFRVWKPTE